MRVVMRKGWTKVGSCSRSGGTGEMLIGSFIRGAGCEVEGEEEAFLYLVVGRETSV